MISLSMRGVRGGVGSSSIVAALGYALHQLGQKVLMIDMCPENTLGLHMGLPLAPASGWARATLDQQRWHEQAWCVEPGLCVLPYGHLNAAECEQLETQLVAHPQLWRTRQDALADAFDWLLFDLPQRLPGHATSPVCDMPMTLVNADAACHVLLQSRVNDTALLLVNRFDSASQLQRDLLLLWQHDHPQSLLALTMHADEAMTEALARREPAGRYAPASLIAQDILSLASWCVLRARGAA